MRALMGLVTGAAPAPQTGDGAHVAGGVRTAARAQGTGIHGPRAQGAGSQGPSGAAGTVAGAGAHGAAGAASPAASFSTELAVRTNPQPSATVRAAGSTGLAFTPGWEEPPVGAGEAARLRWAAEQLEALFLEQLWRGMRRTVLKAGMLDGPGVELFEEMLDQERARAMAAAGVLGLADMVYEQMSRYIADDSNGRTTPGGRVNM